MKRRVRLVVVLALALAARGRAMDGAERTSNTTGSYWSRRKAASRSGPAIIRCRPAKATWRPTPRSSWRAAVCARSIQSLTEEELEPIYYREALAAIATDPVWWSGLLIRKLFYTDRAARPVLYSPFVALSHRQHRSLPAHSAARRARPRAGVPARAHAPCAAVAAGLGRRWSRSSFFRRSVSGSR